MLSQRENRKWGSGRIGRVVRQAALEVLEQRTLLSVTVVQEGESLFIKGDAANDVVDVMDLGGGNIVVMAADATGAAEPTKYEGVASILIDLGAGDDSVSHTARGAGESPDGTRLFDKFAEVSVNTGEGNDAAFLKIDGIKGEALAKVDLGLGDDKLAVTAHDVYLKIKLSGGDGNDSVSTTLTDVFADVDVDLGAGNDGYTIKLTNSNLTDSTDPASDAALDIKAGEGDDQVLIGLLLPAVQKVREAAARIDLGAGNDVLKIDGSTAPSEQLSLNFTKIEWRADAGNDRVEASFFDVFADIAGDMGAGDDAAHIKWRGSDRAVGDPTGVAGSGIKLDLSAGDGNDQVLIGLLLPAVQKVREAAARIDLGAGNDTIKLDASSAAASLNFTKIEMKAGSGRDSVDMAFTDVFADVAADLGSGDDSASFRAAYLKLGDIKGESTDAQLPDVNLDISAGDGNDDVAIGLLLPAVQKVREAAARIDLGAGNDVLKIDGSSAPSEQLSLNFTKIEWRAGAGNDRVEASFFDVFADIAGDMGAGNDAAHIKWRGSDRAVGDPTGVAGSGIKLDLSAGDGNDQILIGLLLPAVQKVREAAARIDLGAGNDTIKLDASSASASLNFTKIEMKAGSGRDSVDMAFSDVYADVMADLGSGDDSASFRAGYLKIGDIKGETTDAQLPDVNLDISAGDGNDDVAIGLLLPAVQKVREAAARVSLGSGNDKIKIKASSGDEAGTLKGTVKMRIDAGSGNDSVEGSFFDVFTELSADLGSGNDAAAVDVFLKLPDIKGEFPRDEAGFKIEISAASGNDRVQVNAQGGGDSRVKGEPYHVIKLKLDAGSGNDSVQGTFTDVFTDASIDLGSGNDSASLRAGYLKIADIKGELAGREGAGFNLDFSAGDGNDAILIGLLLPAVQKVREAAARIDLGDGNDSMVADIITGAGPGGGPHVKVFAGGGAGNDEIDIGFAAAIELEVDGGSGKDRIAAGEKYRVLPAPNNVSSRVHLSGGDDDDVLTLKLADGDGSVIEALVDGGDGRDTAYVSAGVKVVNVEKVFDLSPPKLKKVFGR